MENEEWRMENNGRRMSELATASAYPNSPWNLCLLGDGPLRADLIAQCKAHGLAIAEGAPWQQLPTANCQPSTVSSTPTVFFPGFRQIDELPRFYARAGCFIHPALVEPWGLVVNEAMACGLPVLASNRCGCATDLVQDGINGFIFDPSSVEQLTDLMTRVSAFDFPLSAFSAESTRIIGNWTPARFAENLQSAAKHAIECGACRHRGISSRILLNCLCLIR
jgi:glycosyltransferase involved in cell wall biosynthesis